MEGGDKLTQLGKTAQLKSKCALSAKEHIADHTTDGCFADAMGLYNMKFSSIFSLV